MEDFSLGVPELVCRWRLSNRTLPLGNRHLRALGHRRVGGKPLDRQLVAWAKQHVEWTLADGSAAYPDGVLMLVVDEEGRASMTVGPYEGLAKSRLSSLLGRVDLAAKEAARTCVAPESLWLVRSGTLLWGIDQDLFPSGAATLVEDLALTLGCRVERASGLLDDVRSRRMNFDEAFLVSDELGVVLASDAEGPEGRRFRASYQKLLERAGR